MTGFQEEIQFEVLRRLLQAPEVSQRALAKHLGAGLGAINFRFQALVEKGLVKMQNFSQSKNKLRYASLSLQKHRHRAEHWVVVSGTAEITCGGKKLLLTENQPTYIPLGELRRLANPGSIPLEIIEVQSGSYLGEDDIVRLEDTYGRTST